MFIFFVEDEECQKYYAYTSRGEWKYERSQETAEDKAYKIKEKSKRSENSKDLSLDQ